MDKREPIKQGYLTKQGGRIKTWKKRWFVLTKNRLCYYKNEDTYTSGGDAKGSIVLETVENVCAKSGRAMLFEVYTPGRVYQIKSPSALQCDEWVECIQDTIRAREVEKSARVANARDEESKRLSRLQEEEAQAKAVTATVTSVARPVPGASDSMYGLQPQQAQMTTIDRVGKRKSVNIGGIELDASVVHKARAILQVVQPFHMVGRVFVVRVDGASIGARDANTICIQDSLRSISRNHATIVWSVRDSTFLLEDAGSSNGTYVIQGNTRTKLQPGVPVVLNSGQSIALGQEIVLSVTLEGIPEGAGGILPPPPPDVLIGPPAPLPVVTTTTTAAASPSSPLPAPMPCAVDPLTASQHLPVPYHSLASSGGVSTGVFESRAFVFEPSVSSSLLASSSSAMLTADVPIAVVYYSREGQRQASVFVPRNASRAQILQALQSKLGLVAVPARVTFMSAAGIELSLTDPPAGVSITDLELQLWAAEHILLHVYAF